MKKVIIKNLEGVQTHGAQMEDPTAWIADCIAQNAWGLPERMIPESEAHDPADVIGEEMIEAKPAIPPVLDENGVEIEPGVPAQMVKMLKLRAEYTVSVEDISAQLEQERINREALEYLASTDWMAIRASEGGKPMPEEVKQARAEARARIVR